MEGITQQILLHLIPVCSNSIHLLGDQKYSRLQDSYTAWAPALQDRRVENVVCGDDEEGNDHSVVGAYDVEEKDL